MSKHSCRAAAHAVASALIFVASPVVQAETVSFGRPPSLMDHASAGAQLYSRVAAVSTYEGSRRVPFIECNESFAFWSCREEFSARSVFDSTNRNEVETTGSGAISARRDGFDFPLTDFGQAESQARAGSNYGRLRAEAYAANS